MGVGHLTVVRDMGRPSAPRRSQEERHTGEARIQEGTSEDDRREYAALRMAITNSLRVGWKTTQAHVDCRPACWLQVSCLETI